MHKSIHEQRNYGNYSKPPKKTPLDEVDQLLIGVIIFCIIFVIIVLVLAVTIDNKSQDECSQLEGEYKVVDTAYVGKSVVNIYGCVK